MYVRVLFLLCAYLKINNANTDSDEAKYIDLLPEEEKQEFLNRITKRIVAEIRSGSRSGKSSVEISDERLNQHSAFVQKIMSEESETLKNNRRHGRENNDESVDNDEFKVKPLHEIEDQGNTDILGLPIAENKKRAKKDTYEDIAQKSIENKTNQEVKVSAIPVNLLYDDENDFKNTVTEINAVSKDEIKENLDETLLEVEGLSTDKSRTESEISQDSKIMDNKTEMTDIKNESMKIVINEEKEVHNTRKSFTPIEVKLAESITDIPHTVTTDYETHDKTILRENEAFSLKDSILENKSREITSKEKETDFLKTTLQMPNIELPEKHIESSTDNVLNVISFETERDIIEESLLPENINETSYVTESDTQNNTITELPLTLRNEDLNHTDNKFINDTTYGANKNIIKTETKENLQSATPVDFRIELTTSEPLVENVNADKIKVKAYNKSPINNEKLVENVNKANIKPILRKGSEHLEESSYEYDDLTRLNLENSNLKNNINRYHVFEISNKNPPFIPIEQNSFFEVTEEPHYVPVYNYEPKNAFYSAYNHYGPNFNEHDKIIKTKVSHFHGDEKSNKQNIEHDYTNRGQRNFKPYISNHIYHRPRSVAYHSNLVPVWKDKFPVINFNPNDYLDMDYYLGRSNDVSGYDNKNTKWKPQNINHKYGTSKDNVDDFVEPDQSVEQQNIKEKIKNLRHQLFIQKYGNNVEKRKTLDKNRQNIKKKFEGLEKKRDSMLRELDDTLIIFIPEGGKRHKKNYDYIDKNIAVDYYFSRMNSEELPLFTKNVTNVSDEILSAGEVSNFDESKMKNVKIKSEEHEQVIKEKRVQIPLKQDHVLKIDIGVKTGNKVDVIFKNVKIPESKKLKVYMESYLDVLKDMIKHDNKGLVLYDWLGTTVDVQSAIRKLLDLIKSLEAREQLHYSDFELIKYILNIFRSSKKSIKEASEKPIENINKVKEIPGRKGKRMTSRVINKTKTNIERPIDILNKVLKRVKEIQQLNIDMDDDMLDEFENFLLELQTNLYEIHGAIKQIATVTKFKKQNWFYDLKSLYLTPVNKNTSLSLLLHLASSKLFGLIEESAKNGLEDNFIIFAQNHRTEVDATREEFIFVLRLLIEIKNLKN